VANEKWTALFRKKRGENGDATRSFAVSEAFRIGDGSQSPNAVAEWISRARFLLLGYPAHLGSLAKSDRLDNCRCPGYPELGA
jgi:hypothetical protein